MRIDTKFGEGDEVYFVLPDLRSVAGPTPITSLAVYFENGAVKTLYHFGEWTKNEEDCFATHAEALKSARDPAHLARRLRGVQG